MKRLKIFSTNPNRLLILLLGIWWVMNIVMGLTLELADDEAYYWFISQDLSWGYFDHPPMFAMLTWLGTSIFGNGEIGVRFFAIMLQPLYLYLFWTLVRTPKSTWRSALTYFLVAFSIPQLQLYGFVDTPDAPLLMATALLLWSYKKYIDKAHLRFALLMGVSIALLAYSKYHGALVVIFLVVSNLKLLRHWKFWVGILLAAILIFPHLIWQYDHDWVSFRYHLSDRNRIFSWGYLFEFLANLVGTFNPLVFIPFVIYQFKTKSVDQFDRTLRFIAWGFLGFFLLSSLRGYVQPQWVLPIIFSMLYTTLRAAENYPRFNRYITKVGMITLSIFLIARVGVLFYDGQGIKFQTFNNHASYGALAKEMDGRTLIMDGNYAQASKMNYYSGGRAIAYPSIYKRSSQYQLMDMDDKLYGQKVAVMINDYIKFHESSEKIDSLYRHFQIANSWGFHYDTINFYIPTRRVEITFPTLPTQVKPRQNIALDMDIYNPYSYPIPMKDMVLFANFGSKIVPTVDAIIPLGDLTVLEPNSRTKVKSVLVVPEMVDGKYKFGLSLQRPPATSWYNSVHTEINVTNP